MTTITKKIYLETKYKEFISEIETIIKTNLFPSLEDVDMVDIFNFFSINFFAPMIIKK